MPGTPNGRPPSVTPPSATPPSVTPSAGCVGRLFKQQTGPQSSSHPYVRRRHPAVAKSMVSKRRAPTPMAGGLARHRQRASRGAGVIGHGICCCRAPDHLARWRGAGVPDREPNRPSSVLQSVGGTPILICYRPDHGNVPYTQGAAMTRILNDFLIFACATALVTGIVLAAATLLI
jgi:hypothetical protein